MLLPQHVTPGVDLVQDLICNLWHKTSIGSQSINPVSKRKAWEWLQVLLYGTVNLDKAMDLWFWTIEFVMSYQSAINFLPHKICYLLWNKLGRIETFSNSSSVLLSRSKRLHSIDCPTGICSVLSQVFAEMRALRNVKPCREKYLKGNFEVETLQVNFLSLLSSDGIKL